MFFQGHGGKECNKQSFQGLKDVVQLTSMSST